MKFYLDEDLSPRIAAALRRQGIDAVSTHEPGKARTSDHQQLRFAATERRCLVTRNREDFVRLSREAFENDEPHAGIIICPRSVTGAEIGVITQRLMRIAQRYPEGLGDYDVIYLR